MERSEAMEAFVVDAVDAVSARKALIECLACDDGHEKAYAGLSRWTWRTLTERRLDEDLREWHRLILDVAAAAGRLSGGERVDGAPRRGGLGPRAANERMRALADLVRESVRAAELGPVEGLVDRAYVREVLELLAREPGTPVKRSELKELLGLKQANLSRILSLLAINGVVERMARGREAAFAITPRGCALIRPRNDPQRSLRKDAQAIRPAEIVIAKAGSEARPDAEDPLEAFTFHLVPERPSTEAFPADLRLIAAPRPEAANENQTDMRKDQELERA